MAIPICDRMLSARLPETAMGASSINSANPPQTNMRPADDEEAFGAKVMAQPSRVPSSPLGRKIRISTRNR